MIMETPKWKKIAILVFGLLENLIFSGTIFGWSALNYMLKNEHIYEYVCDNVIIPHIPLINDSYTNYSLTNDHLIDEIGTTYYYDNLLFFDDIYNATNETLLDKLNEFESPPNFSPKYQSHGCAAQDKILNLAYTIGTFCMGFTAFIWGFLLDKWGLRIVRLFINVLITGGTVLLALTDKEKSYLIFPAITLLSLAGVPLRIANMQFADLFPRNRSAVITFYSGAFSASAIVFVLLKYLYDFGMSYTLVSTILVLTSLLMIPFTFFILPSDRIKEETDNDSKLNLFQGKSLSSNLSIISPVTLENYTMLSSPDLMRRHIFNISETINNKPNTYNNKKMFSRKSDSESTITINTMNSSNNSTNIPLKISVLSWSFTLHQWWYSWLITYMVMYVGSMNLWLDRITQDSQTMGDYVKIFGIVQVLALILAPISGVFMDYSVSQADKETDPFKRKLRRVQAGFWPTFTTSLTLAATLVCRFFDKQIAIIISIVFITLLRSFLIAVASAYLRIRFHSQHFNKLLGIMSSTGALVTLLQFPLFVWESYSPSNAVWVNVFNCVCTIVAFLNPLYLLITPLQKHLLRKEEQEEADAKSR